MARLLLTTENTNKNWYAMSDAGVLKQLGEFIKDARLHQNKTQQEIAEAAGVNRSTVVMLEKGSGDTLSSLIQVLRALEQLHWSGYVKWIHDNPFSQACFK